MKTRFILALAAPAFLSACAGFHPASKISTGENPAHVRFAVSENFSLNYLVYLPPAAAQSPDKKWPAIIFLHGSGERGTNVWEVAKHGPPKIVRTETNFPFIVLAPQCLPGESWQPEAVARFTEIMQRRYPVDADRIYLTGLSMGGSGVWNTSVKYPDLFAAAVPICGRADTNGLPYLSSAQLARLRRLPIWAFHGEKDPEVNVKYSRQMTKALQDLNGNIQLTVYPNALHDSWSQTYANPELYAWLLAHTLKTNAEISTKGN